MKHVGELAIIGASVNLKQPGRVRTTQGRTYLTKRRLFHWLLLHTYYNSQGNRIGMPAGQICRHSRTFLFLYKLTDLSHCISLRAIVKVSYKGKQFFFNVELLVCIYIACKKHQFENNQPLLHPFSALIQKNLSTHKCVSTSSQGISFPFQSGSKNVNKRQGTLFTIYTWGIRAFHISLRVQKNVLK